MNALRIFRGEWSLLGFIVLVAFALVLIGVTLWARRRERLGDWGPGLVGVSKEPGFSPADLRASASSTPVASAADRWLLGLAAPFVEQAAMLHDRWSLVPAPCDEAWRRHLLAVASGWGAVRAKEWRWRVRSLESQLAASGGAVGGSIDPRPYLVAELAMLLRLGVALRHTSAPRARSRLAAAASGVRADYGDWLGFCDVFLAGSAPVMPGRITALRADTRVLFAPGGPWHETAWDGAGR